MNLEKRIHAHRFFEGMGRSSSQENTKASQKRALDWKARGDRGLHPSVWHTSSSTNEMNDSYDTRRSTWSSLSQLRMTTTVRQCQCHPGQFRIQKIVASSLHDYKLRAGPTLPRNFIRFTGSRAYYFLLFDLFCLCLPDRRFFDFGFSSWTWGADRAVGSAPRIRVLPSLRVSVMIGLAAGLYLNSSE